MAAANPLEVLRGPGKIQDKPKQLKEAFDVWVKLQPPHIDALSAGILGALNGAAMGAFFGTMTKSTMNSGAPGT